jgi:hypothetical protein
MTEHDKINHPAHYTRMSLTIEPIDLCELLPFCLGNACKYIMRAGFKEGESATDDYRKAAWYLGRALKEANDDADVLFASPVATLMAKKFADKCPLLRDLFDFDEGGITGFSATHTRYLLDRKCDDTGDAD